MNTVCDPLPAEARALIAAARPFMRRLDDNKADVAHQRITFDEFDQRNRAIWAEAAAERLDAVIHGLRISDLQGERAALAVIDNLAAESAETALRDLLREDRDWHADAHAAIDALMSSLWILGDDSAFHSGGSVVHHFSHALRLCGRLLEKFREIPAPSHGADHTRWRAHVVAKQHADRVVRVLKRAGVDAAVSS